MDHHNVSENPGHNASRPLLSWLASFTACHCLDSVVNSSERMINNCNHQPPLSWGYLSGVFKNCGPQNSTTIYYHLRVWFSVSQVLNGPLSTLADHPVGDSPAWGALSHLSVSGIPQKETIRVDAWRYKFQTCSNMPIILYLISDITMVGQN